MKWQTQSSDSYLKSNEDTEFTVHDNPSMYSLRMEIVTHIHFLVQPDVSVSFSHVSIV